VGLLLTSAGRWGLLPCSVGLLFARVGVARADDDKAGAKDTAHDVAVDVAPTGRADLPARLADPDTAYGRIDGDLGLVLGAGATFAAGAPRPSAELRVRYVDTAGVYLTYEDSFGARSADPQRVFGTGLEVRPLFLGRWVTGNELGLRWPDLIIDSFGLEVGAFFQQPAGAAFGSRPGLSAGFGLELPLLGRASGPWIDIHAAGRWSDGVLGGGPVNGPSDRAFVVSVSLAYHQLIKAHLVDLNDRAP
jgi:hypothetical protein